MSKLTKALLPQTGVCRDPWGLGFTVKIRRSGHAKATANAAQTARDRVALARAIAAAKERRKARAAEEQAAPELREQAPEAEASVPAAPVQAQDEPIGIGRLAMEDPKFAADLAEIMGTSKDFQVASLVAGWANDPEAAEPFFAEHQLPRNGAFSRQDVEDRFLAAFGHEDDEEVPYLPPFMSSQGDFVDDPKMMEAASEIVVGYVGDVGALLSPPKEGEEAAAEVPDETRAKAEELAKERDEKLLALGVVRTPYAGQSLREAVLNWITDTAEEIQDQHDEGKRFLRRASK